MSEKEQVSRAKALHALKELMEGAAYAEYLVLSSRAAFDKYKALVATGFTEDQAIKIVAVSPY